MTESNKILTVSYGTFSCTLEGFDDPFGTMRGIAEYFRDLAAEDRYFGAEPPTPDVDMLQSIAQRDLQRRVEARIGDHGVSLRAADSVEDAELSDGDAPAVEDKTPSTASENAESTTSNNSVPEVEDVSETAPLAFEDEYLMADEPEDVIVVDMSQPPATDRPPETIAEKLRRIRAVVSRNIEPAAPAENVFEDDGTESQSAFSETPPKRERALSETIRSITEDIAEDVDAPADNFAETETAVTEDADSLETAEGIASDDNAFAADNQEDAFASSEDEPQAKEMAIAADDEASDSEEVTPIDSEDRSEAIIADIMAQGAADVEEEEEDGETHEPEQENEQSVAEIGKNLLANDEPTGDPVEDLVEDNRAPDEFTDEQQPAETALEPLSEQNGNVGRLLKETDEKFADDDGIRRRRVISQMRAAVAATKAERVFTKLITPDERDEAEQSPYRSDLDKVIADASEEYDSSHFENDGAGDQSKYKPVAEPEQSKPETERQTTTPLVLVSSQRVDSSPPEMEKTRILDNADPSDSFADWAEKMGAAELPDLLEAAAAYSAFVENQPHFSRPEIMKRVARIDPALSLSREAGLRSFGMLLRQGKIRKLQRGQFAISESTRFNPAQRIAGE